MTHCNIHTSPIGNGDTVDDHQIIFRWTDVEVNAPPPTTRYTDDVDVGDKSIAEWQGMVEEQ